MRKTKLWIAFLCCLSAAAVYAPAQTRPAGLWTLTTTTTWQKSPYGPGSAGRPANGGPHKKDVCLTQEMIDQWGALLPQSHGNCKIENKVDIPSGMTANWVCTGRMSGQGALKYTWSDVRHAEGSVHFVGSILDGEQTIPVEWTTQETAVFKSADCGGVQPPPLPPSGR